MKIRRTVPNIKSDHPQKSRKFYIDFLGLDVVMSRDEIITFASPANRTAQISVMKQDDSFAPLHPDVSIEVENVDDVYQKAEKHEIEIVYPITDESWGVRRFFAKDPNGKIINILSHL
jgi:predicted enzyme related to lactoylglutathione lyase